MLSRKRHSPEQIINKSRQTEVAVAKQLSEQILERIWALVPGDYDLTRRRIGGFAYAQARLCLPTASTLSELKDWQPQAPGKAAQRWFFRIHCHHEQGFLPDSKNMQITKSQMVNLG